MPAANDAQTSPPSQSKPTSQSLGRKVKLALRPLYRSVRDTALLMRFGVYDLQRFWKHSGAIETHRTKSAIDADITKLYHAVEKGLALPQPRPGFGAHPISLLCEHVAREIAEERVTYPVTRAIEALRAYAEFNDRNAEPNPHCVVNLLQSAPRPAEAGHSQATRTISLAEIKAATDFDADMFFSTRTSVRRFSAEPISQDQIERAARTAQAAPSVCNRQTCKVHIVLDTAKRDALLEYQNGNRGFGDTIGALAVVTSDLTHFLEPAERYQPFIDGGLFAMNFILGLHAQAVGTCCLNWSVSDGSDKAFRRTLGLPESESVIMLIAIGALQDEFEVARSPRKPLHDVLALH